MIPSTNRGSQTTLPRPKHRTLQEKLGKYVARDAKLVDRLRWEKFVEEIKGQGELTKLEKSHQPALHLLRQYRHMGSPVIISGREWT